MNENIELVRDFIQTFGLYMQAIACAAFILYTRKASAFFYCMLGVFTLSFVQYVLQQELLSLAQNPRFEQVVYNTWYLGFAYTDAMFAIAIVYICKKQALSIDNISRMILISYVTLGTMQVARYLDRIIFESNLLGDLYRIVVPTINISVTLLICGYTLSVLLMGHKASK